MVKCCWDASRGLITPGWVAWGRVSDVRIDPKHPMTPGYITDDASQRFRRKYSTSYASGFASDTQEQSGLTTENRLVTTGETVGSSGRRHGSGWASTPS